ncbi:MAG TPA: UDP-3-O-(3-hydroxymyristoyl)glucosamine N-acyltransferase [Acidobacteriaceae bacterium]|jgi:UDP-3-O-[3-hydroxymyristoyl] glucosamine N-acyltransferase|nr:UDP-3-O-(3-hydroxymyristoyl)glucosamine N-acyltransferase [Acidobacteriaceae bacterium]
MSAKTLSATEIAELLGVVTASTAAVSRVSGLDNAGLDAVVFAEDERTLAAALATPAGLILARAAGSQADPRVLVVKDPRYGFAVCAKALAGVRAESEVHTSAVIDASAKLGLRVKIGARAVVEADVVLGDDVEIAAGAVILRGVEIGDRVVVQAGAVLGATGFGYARNATTGEHLLFPQQGRLVIEDDVEIGANTTIDRGALGETRIGRGTKIDDQVHIGHNCRIGKNVLMASQVGISGSCVVEDGAVLAGQVGLGDHVHIGPGVILGGAAGVFPGKHLEGPGQMFMGVPAEPLKDYLKTIARVRRLK